MSKKIVLAANNIKNLYIFGRSVSNGRIYYNKSYKESSASSQSTANVPGLSEACLKVPSQPVGPGASKDSGYKNPEYFCYDKDSYFEAEVEMLKYRCPQPSVHKPYYQNK